MLVEFLARGTGSARNAASYLLGEQDVAGKPREGAEVLRGDPHQVAAVADALRPARHPCAPSTAWILRPLLTTITPPCLRCRHNNAMIYGIVLI